MVTEPLSTTITRSSPTSRAAARKPSIVPDIFPDTGSTTAVSWVSSASPRASTSRPVGGWEVVGSRSLRARRS